MNVRKYLLKYCLFLSLFTLFFTLNTFNSYAETLDHFESYPDCERDNVIVYHYVYNNVDYYRLLNFNGECYYYPNQEGGSLSIPSHFIRYEYDVSNGSWSIYDVDGPTTISSWNTYNCEILYSTVDVIDPNTNELFFVRTPMSTSLYSGTSGGQMATIILRPMVYLMTCLIGLVIALIALRKGYQWLKAQLVH